jgi:tripartite-type tricarboxylate transporter receptor subunit TctC
MHRRQLLAGAAAAAFALGTGRVARAQAWPRQGVKIAVPFSAGSMTDILARAVAQKLGERWGQQVIVENRPGIAGVQSVARGPADGHTLMLTSNGHVVINAVNQNTQFDAIRDFAAVTRVASMPTILIVPATSKATTLKALIDQIRASGGRTNYASAGLGSSTGIVAELFRNRIGAEMQMVAHRGLPEANVSVLRGDTDLGFTFFNVGGDLMRTGQLRPLAVTGDRRLPQLPDVPTFAEAGLADFAYDAWFGILVPAATPKDVIDAAAGAVRTVVEAPDLRATFAEQSVVLGASAPDAFAAEIRADAQRYTPLLVGRTG